MDFARPASVRNLSLVRNHSKEWKVLSAVEARTRTSPTSVRLPDVVIHKMGEWPTILVQPAMIVIEILSVGDSMTEMEEKCDAYEAMGISDIRLINPARRRGKVWKLGNWTEVTRFEAKGTEIYLDVHWLSRRPMASRQRSKQGVPR